MKAVGYIACVVGVVVLGCLLLLLGVVDAVDGVPGTLREPVIAIPTYLGFVSAMMTAVTVVLAAVAIGIGVVAAYTFSEIKNEASKIADKKVNDLVSEKLSDEAIKARINEITFAQIAFAQRPRGELDEDSDPDDIDDR